MATFARFHTPSYPTPIQGTEQEALGFHFIREDEDQLARPESKGHTSLMIWGFFMQITGVFMELSDHPISGKGVPSGNLT